MKERKEGKKVSINVYESKVRLVLGSEGEWIFEAFYSHFLDNLSKLYRILILLGIYNECKTHTMDDMTEVELITINSEELNISISGINAYLVSNDDDKWILQSLKLYSENNLSTLCHILRVLDINITGTISTKKEIDDILEKFQITSYNSPMDYTNTFEITMTDGKELKIDISSMYAKLVLDDDGWIIQAINCHSKYQLFQILSILKLLGINVGTEINSVDKIDNFTSVHMMYGERLRIQTNEIDARLVVGDDNWHLTEFNSTSSDGTPLYNLLRILGIKIKIDINN